MGKSKSATTNTTTLTNASPTIRRSALTECSLSHLTPSDYIARSVLTAVTITGVGGIDRTTASTSASTSAPACSSNPSATSISRSTCTSCTIAHSHLHHCIFANCTLTNVSSSKFVQADHCTLENVISLRRCTLSDSIIGEWSWMTRCEVRASKIGGGSALRRSTIGDCRVTGSRLKKARLVNCEVEGCVIVNTDLKGMVVKNGVWKNGSLVGRVDQSKDVVVVSRDGMKDKIDNAVGTKGIVAEKRSMERDLVESSDDDAEIEGWERNGQRQICELQGTEPPPPYTA
ncbi:uncharacterized protein BO72DRAFT_51245 [Aspergillus fijiensis CBS 313.89]|uniref:Uncharacterized protein n=1 Tax=Aspergillus fijiensis CBS 313.89 TaxID=1448319 RepID=A0A8G1RTQ5_9EURO|nr:uncharacterized protein BO72DRAFT_51245 [Aspergillus fijiensis CBS 313.89]RAK79074.1 hypothetical protein BO72DRAFT_51245 [Aspergillus fijiensis CBS 313.89]